MPKQYADPKNDAVFKLLFGTQEHKASLISFLNAVLALPYAKRIVDVTVRNPNLTRETLDYSLGFMDVWVEDAEGNKYDIEMQKGKELDFLQRVHCYMARGYLQGMQGKADYANRTPTYVIAILDHKFFFNKADYISYHKILDVKTLENDLIYFNWIFIELDKFTKKLDELDNNLDRWIYFLDHAEAAVEEDQKTLTKQDPVFHDAYQVIDMHNWDEFQLAAYERHIVRTREAINEGHAIGHAAGHAEGEKKKQLEIAKNMKLEGINKATIVKLTGLTLEEIDNL